MDNCGQWKRKQGWLSSEAHKNYKKTIWKTESWKKERAKENENHEWSFVA